MFVELWRTTCARFYGNPLALRNAALKAGYQENPAYADKQLMGTPGTVWDASPSPFVLQSIVLLDDGTCQVNARRADAATVEQAYAETMSSFARPGVPVKKSGDEHMLESGLHQHMITYLMTDEAKQQTWVFESGTSDDPASFMQASIISSPYTDERLHKSKEPFDISGAKASMHMDPAYGKTDFRDVIKPH